MKKLLLGIATLFAAGVQAQSTLMLTDYTNSVSVAPNATLNVVVSATTTSSFDVDIKNTGSTTNTYRVKRYDLSLNSGAAAYFCVAGQCYTSATYISPAANQLTLTAGQSASQLQGSYNMLVVELDEGPVMGPSIVKYTVFNTASAPDTVQFTVKYNFASGVKEQKGIVTSAEIYPNPVSDKGYLSINAASAKEAKISIINTLGATVSEKQVMLSEGKNKVDLNTELLSTGIYFAVIKSNGSAVTKKFIVK